MPKQKTIKAWAIKSHRKNGKIMLVGGQLPIFWLESVAKEENERDYQGDVVPVTITLNPKKK